MTIKVRHLQLQIRHASITDHTEQSTANKVYLDEMTSHHALQEPHAVSHSAQLHDAYECLVRLSLSRSTLKFTVLGREILSFG